MDESAPASEAAESASLRRARLGRRSAMGICIASMIFAATEYVAAAFMTRHPFTITLPASLLVLIGVTIVLIGAVCTVHVARHWWMPLRKLRAILDEARDGAMPIEQIPLEAGGLTPLTEAIRTLLRDSRKLQGQIVQLESEMKHRVERRTDALERQLGKLNAQATRDVLTGLYNRRMLEQSLDELIRRCSATRMLCLMMIDVDDFKLLNDTLGHAAGDALLRSVGQLIRSSIRQQDLPFRCGGDEFVIVLPDASTADGESLSKRLIDLVDALTKTLPLTRRPRLSIGMSTLANVPPEASSKDLMEDADRRLYAVKAERKGKLGRTAGRAA